MTWQRATAMLQRLSDTYERVTLTLAVRPRAPLPPLGGDWAIFPDFAGLIVRTIRQQRPRVVVELGSGVSTVITAYMMKRYAGHLVSVDHSEEFMAVTRQNVRQHGLQEFVTFVHAPLCDMRVDGREHTWYRTSDLRVSGPIDLLVVDGPVASTCPLARYPALPMLRERMAESFTVLMDDTRRRDEREIIRLWSERYPELRVSNHERYVQGAGVLTSRRPGRTRRWRRLMKANAVSVALALL
jgi:hypothetical protein